MGLKKIFLYLIWYGYLEIKVKKNLPDFDNCAWCDNPEISSPENPGVWRWPNRKRPGLVRKILSGMIIARTGVLWYNNLTPFPKIEDF